jgi:hypothetical protein
MANEHSYTLLSVYFLNIIGFSKNLRAMTFVDSPRF